MFGSHTQCDGSSVLQVPPEIRGARSEECIYVCVCISYMYVLYVHVCRLQFSYMCEYSPLNLIVSLTHIHVDAGDSSMFIASLHSTVGKIIRNLGFTDEVHIVGTCTCTQSESISLCV